MAHRVSHAMLAVCTGETGLEHWHGINSEHIDIHRWLRDVMEANYEAIMSGDSYMSITDASSRVSSRRLIFAKSI